MSNPEHVDKIEELLRQVAVVITLRGRENLANFSITPPQFGALITLRDAGEITMGELCAKLYLACSTVTDLIGRMEKNGYVERFKDSKDRRVIRLRVLPAGLAVYEDVIRTRKAYLQSILPNLNPSERDHLISSLQQLYALMKQEE